MKGFNGKVRCVKNDSGALDKLCKAGQVLEFKDGRTIWNDGNVSCYYETITEFNKNNSPKIALELVTEEFTKADLKTGDLTISKNGCIHKIVLEPSNTLIDLKGAYFELSDLTDDLNVTFSHRLGIVTVLRPRNKCDVLTFDISKCDIVWKRQEPRNFTKSEAAKILSEHFDEVVTVEGVKGCL